MAVHIDYANDVNANGANAEHEKRVSPLDLGHQPRGTCGPSLEWRDRGRERRYAMNTAIAAEASANGKVIAIVGSATGDLAMCGALVTADPYHMAWSEVDSDDRRYATIECDMVA